MFCYPDMEHLWKQFQYTLHALPLDKWEILLAYSPPSFIQYLRHLFSPKLCDSIFGGPRNPLLGNLYADFFRRKDA
jgi:hypothetical protein